jgi:hypothetical protein
MTTTRLAAGFALLLCAPGASALAATCHMTVQGVPVIDDQDCTSAGRGRNVVITTEGGDAIRIRRSIMSGRLMARRPGDGRLRRVPVSYGLVVTSNDSDEKTCYFNQKATLCLDP